MDTSWARHWSLLCDLLEAEVGDDDSWAKGGVGGRSDHWLSKRQKKRMASSIIYLKQGIRVPFQFFYYFISNFHTNFSSFAPSSPCSLLPYVPPHHPPPRLLTSSRTLYLSHLTSRIRKNEKVVFFEIRQGHLPLKLKASFLYLRSKYLLARPHMRQDPLRGMAPDFLGDLLLEEIGGRQRNG